MSHLIQYKWRNRGINSDWHYDQKIVECPIKFAVEAKQFSPREEYVLLYSHEVKEEESHFIRVFNND